MAKTPKTSCIKALSNKKEKKILQQGGFLGAILPVLATVLGSIING
jgi:hypothetical protein